MLLLLLNIASVVHCDMREKVIHKHFSFSYGLILVASFLLLVCQSSFSNRGLTKSLRRSFVVRHVEKNVPVQPDTRLG